MKTEDYEYIRSRFFQADYDSEIYPASIARVMFDKRTIDIFLIECNQSYNTNIKLYVRWLRKTRNKMFKNNNINSKPSKFVSVYGINRKMNIFNLVYDYMYKRKMKG
jgi:hypothetical protein